MRNFALASLTFLIGLFSVLFVAELAIRLFWTPPSELSTVVTEKHPFYGWAPRPGITGRQISMEFNYEFTNTAQGLRGKVVFAASRPENIQNRILFLGDSFTYGNGSANDDTFVEKIHSSIASTEVINSGTNGYGQRQQLAVLDTLGAALKPDLIVLMFFWNDLEDNIKNLSPEFSVSSDGQVIRTDLSIPKDFDPLAARYTNKEKVPTEKKLWRRSFLYKLFKEGARGFRHRLFGSKERIIQTREQQQNAWNVTTDLLQLIKLRSEEVGSTLLVVSIPDYELISTDGRLAGQKAINIEIEDKIRNVCGSLNIEYIDLLPELKSRQAVAPGPFYYATDRHLTPDGNTAVENILTPILEGFLSQHHFSTRRP